MMENIYVIFVFALGLIIGSFLNVIIYRLPHNISILKEKRSFCPKCKKKLKARELIPLFSFLFLGGRCSQCKQKISLRYPLIELITGTLFLITWFYVHLQPIISYQSIIELLYYFITISLLIVVFFIDLDHYIIPDSLVIISSTISIVYLVTTERIVSILNNLNGFITTREPLFKLLFSERFIINNSIFLNHVLFAIIGIVFFAIIIFITKGKGMGMGDLKFSGLMGLILGGKIIGATYIAFILGAIVGIVLILLKKKKIKSMIPFGPFLVIGTLLGMFL